MDNYAEAPGEMKLEGYASEDRARYTVATEVAPGEPFELVKFVAYGWSSERSVPNLRDQVDAALTAVGRVGWDGVEQEQADAWGEFWRGADVEIEGADDIQQAVRFGMFHTLQAAVRAERRAIPAKGLTGTGYDGHAFWDTEMFVLPMLSATWPQCAGDAVRWRLSTIDSAFERARTLGLEGAAFPWRTIRGEECSAYWPAGTAALHVNADVALAAVRHAWWTNDEAFARDVALPLLVATARLFTSMTYQGADGNWHLDGVTGPDEYSAVVDDNVFTNLAAARNLIEAARFARRFGEAAAALSVAEDEAARWEQIGEGMALPINRELGVHEQDRGSTLRARWDFERTAADGGYPLLLHAPYFQLYRRQVAKQADLVLALHWLGDAFTQEEKARNFEYYEALTVRDSSLSACTQAVVAAEVGQLELAADYLGEAALMDLHNLEHNSSDGLHIASLAGAWLSVVAGFGGMRDLGEDLRFRPQLPPGWRSLSFGVRPSGRRLRVTIRDDHSVSYALQDSPTSQGPGAGEPLSVLHCDGTDAERVTIESGASVERRWTPVEPLTPRPTQPAGRAPRSRSSSLTAGD
jgi:alpha,alpha-trehalose phosphorylase